MCSRVVGQAGGRFRASSARALPWAAGDEPESLDKEIVRRALLDAGYHGDGPPPELPGVVWATTSARYIDAYERITGQAFVPGRYPVAERIVEVLDHAC